MLRLVIVLIFLQPLHGSKISLSFKLTCSREFYARVSCHDSDLITDDDHLGETVAGYSQYNIFRGVVSGEMKNFAFGFKYKLYAIVAHNCTPDGKMMCYPFHMGKCPSWPFEGVCSFETEVPLDRLLQRSFKACKINAGTTVKG